MTGDTPKTERGWPWGRIILILSLSLNMLVAGLVAGTLLRDGPDRSSERRLEAADLGFGPYVAALGPEERRTLVQAARREGSGLREHRAKVRRQFEEMLTLLRAETLDVAALDRLLSEQQAALTDWQGIGQRLLVENLAQMDAAERAEYADRLDRLLRRRAPPGTDGDRPGSRD